MTFPLLKSQSQDVDASLILAMAVVIDEIHDEENPDAGGEALPDMLEDAKGLPMPRAPQAMKLGWEDDGKIRGGREA